MQNLKPIIAKNISNLRQKNNMTQGDLASRLNYSDKAVSKWERAESIPDVAVLKEIADLFSVTLDYLVTDDNERNAEPKEEVSYSDNFEDANKVDSASFSQTDEAKTTENQGAASGADNKTESDTSSTGKPKNKFIYMSSPLRKHGFITGMSVILVWLVATLAFVLADIFTKDIYFHWLAFVYAIPASAIVWLVFNSLWFNKRRNYFIISLLMWSSLLSIVLSLLPFGTKMVLLLILGIPGQVIIYMWSSLKKKVELEE
ncbi:MAG: helix-turn-helix transcriptional regulator [Lachnospiraceae bacterium]|nr:helix-turn-helix transcriptional regulator [Lachnospiraceae bacterium]